MTSIRAISGKSAGFAVALLALVSGASASEIRVHVPMAASWGGQMLPAGDYRIDISSTSPFARVSVQGKQATVFVTSATPLSGRDHSYLRMVDVNGTQTVRYFDSGVQGLTFRFIIPKATHTDRHALVASAVELQQR